jgi:hypothetical protein
MSKLLDSALEAATAGETLNPEGTHLLLGWLADPRNDKSLDRARVQAAVDRHYGQQPGADVPAAHLDVYTIAPPGASAQGRSAVASLAEQMGRAYIAPKGTA